MEDLNNPSAFFEKLSQKKWNDIDNATLNLRVASSKIEKTYTDLLKQITKDNLDLKDVEFGFSVDEKGKIVLANSAGLSDEQSSRVEKALNGSEQLVKEANDLANAHIALFKAESDDAVGIKFTRENYSKTIDIGTSVVASAAARTAARDGSANDIHKKNWDNNWRQQLNAKGERYSV
ncbi:hypothetical protein [Zymobacter sp. IVIA_5232.4 C2]|uniref:hypothetical protein n=1 Tax=Zymobacter sp. IVIA_5232.4 C2 TaxID=3394855 RepID=UPI0039C01A33